MVAFAVIASGITSASTLSHAFGGDYVKEFLDVPTTLAGARRKAGHRLEDRNREQLYQQAQKLGISGRSKMGKSELIAAIRRGR